MSRVEKLAETIKKDIAELIAKKIKDQRIGFVSITDVVLAEDSSVAKVYVSCFGDSTEKNRSMNGLRSAKSFIRSTLAKKLQLKHMPDLVFIKDDSLERGSAIIEKLDQLKREREAREQSESTDQN